MIGDRAVAHAKLNLALHVRAREADGYHSIETLFAFCADGDVLTLIETPGLAIEGPFAAALAGDGDNLVTRAARSFAAAFGTAEHGFLLDKRLPVAAGIGGGSADAAAALRLLAKHDGIDPRDPRLLVLAGDLGADVPACLLSETARGTGRGDRLDRVKAPELRGMPVLLVNPMLPLATGPVFRAWDGVDRGPLGQGDALDCARGGRNDLEPPARGLLPAIDDVLAALSRRDGVILSRMSGSGATCFALFETVATRDAVAGEIANDHPRWWRLATSLL